MKNKLKKNLLKNIVNATGKCCTKEITMLNKYMKCTTNKKKDCKS